MEFTNAKHDDLRTAHKGTAKTPARENRDIHVQAGSTHDQSEMGKADWYPEITHYTRNCSSRRWYHGSAQRKS